MNIKLRFFKSNHREFLDNLPFSVVFLMSLFIIVVNMLGPTVNI